MTEPLRYRDDDIELTGYLAWEDGVETPRPGVLLVHGGAGLDEHARAQARRYAALGYVVLACDMFGPGVAGNRERIIATVLGMRDDPDRLVRRGLAGLRALRGLPKVDGRLAAVGFCFGGLAVLTLARHGAELAGVVSLHGSLATPRPAAPGAVRAKILVCHGARDPHVPLTDLTAFMEEMGRAGADWQVNVYGNAMHGFTHADAVPGATPGVEYDEEADRRSFQAAQQFLTEVFS